MGRYRELMGAVKGRFCVGDAEDLFLTSSHVSPWLAWDNWRVGPSAHGTAVTAANTHSILTPARGAPAPTRAARALRDEKGGDLVSLRKKRAM